MKKWTKYEAINYGPRIHTVVVGQEAVYCTTSWDEAFRVVRGIGYLGLARMLRDGQYHELFIGDNGVTVDVCTESHMDAVNRLFAGLAPQTELAGA